MPATGDDVPRPGTTSNSWLVIILSAVGAVAVGAAFSFTILIALALSLVFIFGGFVYGVTAMAVIAHRWVTLPKAHPSPTLGELVLTDVHRFATGTQRLTFVFNILLLLNLTAFTVMPETAPDSLAVHLIPGGIAQVAALVLVFVDGY